MLAEVAAEGRRWTRLAGVEMVLVSAVVSGSAQTPVAVARGDRHAAPLLVDRVLRIVLAFGADEFIVSHNHASGLPPSPDDLAVTRRLVAASALVNLRLRAHLVITDSGWFDCLDPSSFLQSWSDHVTA